MNAIPSTNRGELPDRIYKYRTPERIEDLRSLTMRITQPAVFNDPFEVDPVFETLASREEIEGVLPGDEREIFRQAWEELDAPEKQMWEQMGFSFEDLWFFLRGELSEVGGLKDFAASLSELVAPQIREQFRSKFGNEVGVVSLSEKPDSLLMWSHYTADHRGFVIEFDGTHNFFWQPRTENDELRHLRRVEYTEERPSGTFLELGAEGLFLTKSSHWSYEKEWRILFSVDEADRVLNENDEHPIYLKDLPMDAISAVIIGCRASDAIREEIQELTSVGQKLEHVEVFESDQNPDRFDLDIRPLG